jgi:hypothetical protein
MTTYSLRNLDSFGDVAAEDDPVLDYFLATDAVRKIESNSVFVILGRKGSGKTAIVRYFAEGEVKGLAQRVSLRGYPWSVHAERADAGASPIEAYVSSWRYLIATELGSLTLAKLNDGSKEAKSLSVFLKDNYGGPHPDLETILRPKKLRLSEWSFEPEIMGNKLGGVALDRDRQDFNFGLELNALSDAILSAVSSIAARHEVDAITLHFDELDQGLAELNDQRRSMLVGLILAARSIRLDSGRGPVRINPVIYLRTDIWNELSFSDKNKVSETHSHALEWDSDSLRALVDRRLGARLGSGANWDQVVEDRLMRGSQSKWNHVLSRTFLRPRDVIKFLNAAVVEAHKRTADPLLLSNQDIVTARNTYSSYLKSELDDEILAHWAEWEEALQACSAISTVTFEKDEFFEEYRKRRSSSNPKEADEALRLLYSFSVIGYERRSGYGGSSWAFHYTDPEAGWDQSATRFKVHLGLKEYAKLREDRA